MSDTTVPTSSKWNYKEYLVQVSLIVLSVLSALALDRCNQNWQDNKRLKKYYTLIYEELQIESDRNLNNIGDCKKDVEALEAAINGYSSTQDPSLSNALGYSLMVLARGVFRPFPPLTYERMVANGEATLLSNIELNNRLSSYSAFRLDYFESDLKAFDETTLDVLQQLGEYVNTNCVLDDPNGNIIECVFDKKSLRKRGPIILTRLYRQAQIRLFHLEIGQEGLEKTIGLLEEEMGISQ